MKNARPLPRFALVDVVDGTSDESAPTLAEAITLCRLSNIVGDLVVVDRATGHVVADAQGAIE